MSPLRSSVVWVCASMALVGCASIGGTSAPGWRVEPTVALRHGVDPVNSRGYYALGLAHQGEGRWQEAAEAYLKAVAHDPSDARALNALGIAQAMLSRPDSAIAAFERAVDLSPQNAGYRNNLGFALLSAGRPAGALAHLREALVIDPHYPIALENRARAEQLLAEQRAASRQAAVPAEPVSPSSEPALAEAPPERAADVAVEAPVALPVQPQAVEDRLRGYRLEVANGNGVPGAAARVREWLLARGHDAARLTNERPFNVAETVVQ